MIDPKTLHEKKVSQSPEAMADDLFHELDKDGDQRISRQEFCEGALQNPIVLRLLQCGPPKTEEPGDPVTE